MRVTINDDKTRCTIESEPGDPAFRDGGWGDGESRLLYHVKLALREQGYDMVKKRMWKDGHMVDERQQYLRTRKGKPILAIWNDRWVIEGADDILRRDGHVSLTMADLST